MLVFIAVTAFSLVAMGWGPLSSGHCHDSSCCGVWAVGVQASVAVACGLSSCGTQASLLPGMWDFPGPGIKPCFLHWQVDSLPVSHHGSPQDTFIHLKNLEESTELL